jgi:ankyrin repeat protein
VNAYGWGPLTYIWGDVSNPLTTADDFVTLLTSDGFYPHELDNVDVRGWTLLHRVASFGAPGQVRKIIKLGANVMAMIPPLQWTPIHQTAYYGKLENFLELLPHDQCFARDIDTPDTRGWTLLHIAASAGREGIVRELLNRGADPYRRSWPSHSHMPECLYGKECTPAEVALAQSCERYQSYMNLVIELGLDKEVSKHQEDVNIEHLERRLWSRWRWFLLLLFVFGVVWTLFVPHGSDLWDGASSCAGDLMSSPEASSSQRNELDHCLF